jgi:Uncharacterized protein, possibly involved in aromatic compounds catabolism
MKHKVVDKKHNSNHCMVCGIQNPFSMGARFYELDNQELVCTFETKDFHQSYPGRLHGGMAAAILDETIGRAIDALEPGIWAVTVELNVKYKKTHTPEFPSQGCGQNRLQLQENFRSRGRDPFGRRDCCGYFPGKVPENGG